jgi:hypothetical protein
MQPAKPGPYCALIRPAAVSSEVAGGLDDKCSTGVVQNSRCVETLIFQREFEEHVTRSQPDEKSKEASHRSEEASRDQRRHQSERAYSYSEHYQQRARPLNQEELNPGVPKFVFQQYVNRFWERDQITERAVLVRLDKHFVRHNS